MSFTSVLIVDDSDTDRYLLKRILKATGLPLKIYESIDGSDAMGFLSDYEGNKRKLGDAFPPMVIFLDVNMPLMGGIEFLEKFAALRAEADYSSTVIMMYSSSERPKDKDTAFSYEFVKDYITKGAISIEELKLKVMDSRPAE